MLNWPASGVVTLADPCAGKGDALLPLADYARAARPGLTVLPCGAESDRGRAHVAHESFALAGGWCVWACMDDLEVSGGASLLWLNPPYDHVRGVGRTETLLLDSAIEWVARGGIVVAIVQRSTWNAGYYDLGRAFTRKCDILGCWDYPEPERSEFGQSVVIARRRTKDVDYGSDTSVFQTEWPSLDMWKGRPFTVPAGGRLPTVVRTELGYDQVTQATRTSPLRAALLQAAMQPAPPLERPLLRLRPGHMALALAGGLCDGAFTDPEGRPFLLKGTLTSEVKTVNKTAHFDTNGHPDGVMCVDRTAYTLGVRALRHDGTLENYNSDHDAGRDGNGRDGDTAGDTADPGEDTLPRLPQAAGRRARAR